MPIPDYAGELNQSYLVQRLDSVAVESSKIQYFKGALTKYFIMGIKSIQGVWSLIMNWLIRMTYEVYEIVP